MRPIPLGKVEPPIQRAAPVVVADDVTRSGTPRRGAFRRSSSVDRAWRYSLAKYRRHPQWVVSGGVHLVVLLVLAVLQVAPGYSDKFLELVVLPTPETPIEEEEVLEVELALDVDDLQPRVDDPVSLSQQAAERAGDAPELNIETPSEELASTLEAPLAPTDDFALLLALANDNTSVAEKGETPTLKGATVQTGGDAGSVDRLTIEILRYLETQDVLVVWLMDASASLTTRRDQIIERFGRIYDELDALAEDRGDRLLTGVVSFGQQVAAMTKPTADRTEIEKAVRSIQIDDSGVENVFVATGMTVRQYAPYQKLGRKLMLVVLTDEMGDDVQLVDDAVDLASSKNVPIYVIGPIAPFGRRQLQVRWTDEETGADFYLPVERGPESVQVEVAELLRWYKKPQDFLLSSGFGPFGLTRLARETGGIYFLHDDRNLPGPRFDIERMVAYAPEYEPVAAYAQRASTSPLRRAVLRTTHACNQSLPSPTIEFLAAGIQFEIRDARDKLAEATRLLDQGLAELDQAEQYAKSEKSPRWLAHFDLLLGRLLANQLRCHNSLPLLEEMYRQPKMPQDSTKNGWALAGDEQTTLAAMDLDKREPAAGDDPEGENPAAGEPAGADRAGADPAMDIARRAKLHLQRVVDQHPGTPWAELARTELNFPLGFQWREALVIPPDGVKLPWDRKPWEELTEREKEAKLQFEARQKQRMQRQQLRAAAQARVPKL